MGDKGVETLCNKIEFLSILVTFPPFPPKQCWFFYFFDCTDHSAYTTLNWGAGGIRELTLEANKIEQMLKYWKVSFPKSVSTAFVAHCSSYWQKLWHQSLNLIQALWLTWTEHQLAWTSHQLTWMSLGLAGIMIRLAKASSHWWKLLHDWVKKSAVFILPLVCNMCFILGLHFSWVYSL